MILTEKKKYLKQALFLILEFIFIFNKNFSQFYNQNNYIDKNFDQKFIHITIEVNDSNTYINSEVKFILKAKKNISSILLEFAPYFSIHHIKFNEQSCNYYYNNDSLLIYLPVAVDSGNLFNISISYSGFSICPVENRGLINSYCQEYNARVTWTLSQPFHTKHWLPIKQDLNDRFDSAWVFIIVDSTLKAGSEGVLANITKLPNGKLRYEWKESYPIVYYLLSIAVSKYKEYNFKMFLEEVGDSLLIMNYIYNDQCLIDNKQKIDFTGDLIKLYNKLFGLYPFYREKYGHCMVPFAGGMEHQTMTSLGSFVDFLVAHELAHMWFGNNITCASWQDIWINEGFASYAEYLYKEFLYNYQSANETIRHFQYRARKEPEGSVYVPFEDINNEPRIFNGNLSYKKGACLIHMIRYLCENDSLFFEGLKKLQINYKNSTLIGEDVKNVFEELTGKDFTNLFNEFYYGKGYPIYNIQWWQDTTCVIKTLFIRIAQRSSSSENNLFTIPLQFKVEFQDYDTLIKIYPADYDQTISVAFKNTIKNLVFDPFDYVLDSLESFVKINIKENAQHAIIVKPNPVSQQLYISGLENDSHINIFDYKGQLIKSIKAFKKNIFIDLQNLSAGYYVLEIISPFYYTRRSFVKTYN